MRHIVPFSSQLFELIEAYEKDIARRCGEDMVSKLRKLGESAREAAVWHGWSTYGREGGDGVWIPAVDLCNGEIARDLLQKAEKSFETAKRFLEVVSAL